MSTDERSRIGRWRRLAAWMAEGEGRVARTVRITVSIFRRMLWSQLPQMAGALSFRTIFSMIPVLVIGLAVIGAFADSKDTEALIQRILDFTGLSGIHVEGAEGAKGVEDAAAAAPILPQADLNVWIKNLVAKVQSIPFKTIGGIGLLLLAYAAMAMLVEVERAFNRIYRVPTQRSWMRRIAPYWTLLTLGGVFLAATFYVGDRFQQLVGSFVVEDGGGVGGGSGGGMGFGGVLLTATGYLVTVLISTILLVVAYTTVPNTKVRMWPAIGGAVVGAILWEAGKWGFLKYLKFSTSYARFYDQLALIPLFMLWIYLTWMVVLVGLEVAHALQTYDTWEREEKSAAQRRLFDGMVVDASAAVRVCTAVARRFAKGQTADLGAIAHEAGLPGAVVSRLTEAMQGARILRRVEERESEAYLLARPAETIRVAEVLTTAHGLTTPPGPGSPESLVNVSKKLVQAQIEAAGEETVADLIGGGRGAGVPGVAGRATMA